MPSIKGSKNISKLGKKVFVTGATGFLGSYLVRLLIQEGYQVKASKRNSSSMKLLGNLSNKVEWHEGDILDYNFLETIISDVEYVFHCAATVSFSPKDTERMMSINVNGTSNIVKACIKHSTKKLIHTSSIAAIGRSEEQFEVSEESIWTESKFNTTYAKSKYLAEQEVWKGVENGLKMTIVNPSIILGAGNWNSGSCKLFTTVLNGLKFYPVGNTGFVDVKDVAKSMLLLAESNIHNNRYIINAGNYSYQLIFELMATYLSVPKPSIKVTPLLRNIAWRLEKFKSHFTKKHPIITRETSLISSLSYSYSNKRSVQDLGIVYTPIEDTIRESCIALLQYKEVQVS